jgi:endoglucanase
MRSAAFPAVFCVLLLFCNIFAGPVAVYGALKACTINNKGRLCGSNTDYTNTAVQLRGVSLGWSNTGWESAAFFNAATVNAMIDDWKAEIIRVPLGYSEQGGYQGDANGNWTRAKAAIEAAIAKDVYVIIDWHSHKAHNETNAAKTFFETTVAEYHNNPHVIYEIYNEPTGVAWSGNNGIKTYADAIVSAIRAKSANNLILVGTPNWSQNVDAVTGNSNSVSGTNIAYVLHFYAASHSLTGYTASGSGATSRSFQTAINMVLDAGYPVFVSEYGTTHADGGCSPSAAYSDCQNGNQYSSHNATSANNWHTFMDNNLISNVAWNINDKYEGSAFFGTNSGTTSSANRFPQSPTTNFKDKTKMTTSGQYIYDKLVAYAASAPWRNVSTPISTTPKVSGSNGMQLIKNGVSLQVSDNAVLEVFSLNGNLIRKSYFANGVYSVQFSDLPKSLYIAVFKFNNHKEVLYVPVR